MQSTHFLWTTDPQAPTSIWFLGFVKSLHHTPHFSNHGKPAVKHDGKTSTKVVHILVMYCQFCRATLGTTFCIIREIWQIHSHMYNGLDGVYGWKWDHYSLSTCSVWVTQHLLSWMNAPGALCAGLRPLHSRHTHFLERNRSCYTLLILPCSDIGRKTNVFRDPVSDPEQHLMLFFFPSSYFHNNLITFSAKRSRWGCATQGVGLIWRFGWGSLGNVRMSWVTVTLILHKHKPSAQSGHHRNEILQRITGSTFSILT